MGGGGGGSQLIIQLNNLFFNCFIYLFIFSPIFFRYFVILN